MVKTTMKASFTNHRDRMAILSSVSVVESVEEKNLFIFDVEGDYPWKAIWAMMREEVEDSVSDIAISLFHQINFP